MENNQKIQRNRLILVLIAGLFIIPLGLAWGLFYSGWKPNAQVNRGTLIQPVRPLALSLQSLDGQQAVDLKGQWTMLTVSDGDCNQACWENLYKMRQVRVLLNKDSQRVEKALLVRESEALSRFDELTNAYPQTQLASTENWQALLQWLDESSHQNSIYLVDPQGYLMMFYLADADPKDLLKDLKRLLKYS